MKRSTPLSVYFLLMSALVLSTCKSKPDETSSESHDEVDETKKVTISDVDRGIRANIETMTMEGNGYFNFKNDTMSLSLRLVRVHTEYLSVLGSDEFFACVDLATEGGDVYDVDFFLKGTAEEMSVTKTTIHKLNGKPYYTWKQAKDKTWYTVPVKQATNDLLGVIEGSDKFSFTYMVRLPEIRGNAQMWIPIAQSDNYQVINMTSIKSPVPHEMITEKEYGNTLLYTALSPEHSGQEIIIDYEVKRIEKGPYEEDETDLVRYLGASTLLPVGDRFSTIAEQAILERKATTPLTKARALYDYIIDNMRYAKQGVYGTGDANYACDSKSGNCTEFHSLFISLARSAGIPARFAIGAAIPSERNEGEVDGYHCWAEFYAEGKWWPVDISEGNKYTALATYYFGHHPANRIELSRGRDLTPDPIPQSGPINFLAYPLLEIEGEVEYAETVFSFRRPVVPEEQSI